jgi:hypothetical protein
MEEVQGWNRKSRFIMFGVVFLLACLAFYFSPNLIVYKMQKAAESKDADTLSSYVDFPSVRESLKANYYGQLESELAKSKRGSSFNAFATSLAATLIDPMVDGLATPESLATLLRGEIPETAQHEDKSKSQAAYKGPKPESSTAYKGFNRFILLIKKKDSAEKPIEFVFKRDGLISWKLSGLRIN